MCFSPPKSLCLRFPKEDPAVFKLNLNMTFNTIEPTVHRVFGRKTEREIRSPTNVNVYKIENCVKKKTTKKHRKYLS